MTLVREKLERTCAMRSAHPPGLVIRSNNKHIILKEDKIIRLIN